MTAAKDPQDSAKVMRSRDGSFRVVLHELRGYVSEFEPLWDLATEKIDSDHMAALQALIQLEIRLRHFGSVAIDNLLEDVDAVTDALDKELPDVDDEVDPTLEDLFRLMSGDPEDRAWAAQNLIGFDTAESLALLRALLDDPVEEVREAAAQSLAISEDRDSMQSILRLLADDRGERVNAVRWAAVSLARGHPNEWSAVVDALRRIRVVAKPEVQKQIDHLLRDEPAT